MKNTLKVTTPSDREIVFTRGFDAPRTLVFDAFTKPELVKRWLLGPPGWTMPVCEIDLRVGGKFRYVWRNVDGREMGMGGVFRAIVPPERLVSTELFDEDWTGGETLVTIVLVEQDGKTTVAMTVLYASREARDGALKTGMEQGMAAGYDRLAELLATAGSQGSSHVQELIRLEEEWGRAMVQNDAEAIGRYMADDWTIIGPDGSVSDKATFLGLVKSGALTHDVMEADEIKGRVYGDTAVLTARGVSGGKYRGQAFRVEERVSDVFVRQDGQWRCVLTHLSRIGEKRAD